MPLFMASVLHELLPLIPSEANDGWHFYYTRFTGEWTESRSGLNPFPQTTELAGNRGRTGARGSLPQSSHCSENHTRWPEMRSVSPGGPACVLPVMELRPGGGSL